MGQHYIPQEYLRGFQSPDEPGMIWMYDKKLHRFVHASIKSVVQEEGFYSEETERMLNELVEGPANQVLQKLRHGHQIDETERSKLALYLGTMLMRVPRRRRKAFELAPEVLEQVIDSVSRQVAQWAETTSSDPSLIARRLAEVKQIQSEYLTNLPSGVVEQVRAPWPSDRIMTVVSAMTWRIVPATGDSLFLTSDNPAWFAEGLGIGRSESELTFPLASDLALIAGWQGAPHETLFLETRPAVVREVNRRVASGAERFVFYHAQKDWVAQISDKQNPFLSRIEWGRR